MRQKKGDEKSKVFQRYNQRESLRFREIPDEIKAGVYELKAAWGKDRISWGGDGHSRKSVECYRFGTGECRFPEKQSISKKGSA